MTAPVLKSKKKSKSIPHTEIPKQNRYTTFYDLNDNVNDENENSDESGHCIEESENNVGIQINSTINIKPSSRRPQVVVNKHPENETKINRKFL